MCPDTRPQAKTGSVRCSHRWRDCEGSGFSQAWPSHRTARWLHLAGTDFRQLVNFRASSESLALASGVLFAVCALVFYVNALGAGSRWKDLFADSPDRPLLTIHSYIGALAAASAAWALFSNDWTALAFAAVMLIVAALGRALESPHLQVQYALLGSLTLYRGLVVNLHLESPEHAHLRMRLLTLPILGAAFYLTAKLAALRDDPTQRTIRGLFALAAPCFHRFRGAPVRSRARAALSRDCLAFAPSHWSRGVHCAHG